MPEVSYLITPGIASLCYINRSDMAEKFPWEGATAVYTGAGTPLEIRGPFPVPPFVEASLDMHFRKVFATPLEDRRTLLASIDPWTVYTPGNTAPEDDGTPKEA